MIGLLFISLLNTCIGYCSVCCWLPAPECQYPLFSFILFS